MTPTIDLIVFPKNPLSAKTINNIHNKLKCNEPGSWGMIKTNTLKSNNPMIHNTRDTTPSNYNTNNCYAYMYTINARN